MEYNLRQLYGTAFGYIGLPFDRLSTSTEVGAGQPFDTEVDNNDAPVEYGLLGTPIHLPCELDGVRLPNEPLIDFSRDQLIVMTPIDGNDGTFKEHYSNGDMQITIRGICVDEDKPDSYPEEQVRAIRNLVEKRTHIRIVNRLAALWNVEHLAIVSHSFPAFPGEIGMQKYELRCVSDKEFQLRVRER